MLLSRSCEYGLRAALYLAGQPPETYVPIRSISEALGIPYHFLAKIAQLMNGAGIIVSVRGPAGGVALARPASALTLEDVVLALDGPGIFQDCVLGLPGCGNRRPCPLHDQWHVARKQFHDMFSATSMADVARRIEADDLRLVDFVAIATDGAS
jgi:Rrf2 family transcriptional regulator, iron-sulfur cluster assembly transcription factor